MVRARILSACIWLLPAMLFAAGEVYRPVNVTPPQPAREFRGAWLVTIANKDWPSRPGLSVNDQKAELMTLLDRAVQLKLNAVIFQVRPSCDAVYASSIEPWSEYLTGTMGKAPQPFYDPLAFAIQEAHRRGLELHAWFNPFRALHPQGKSPVAGNHVSRTHPELIRHYGDQIWLDPGDPAVRKYVLSVVMDVVRRYDVDGVHFDDYFYPYPQKDAAGRALEFPDDTTWRTFGLAAGYSNRDDWRRANINQFIQSVYQSIKTQKPWVKFGISPFGIWRPMNPQQIRGLDAYASLYADSRLWFASGWLDYFAPQLYWSADAREQSFPVLLGWWARQNARGRNFWPGLAASAVGTKFTADEIGRQIATIRRQPGASGEILYHLRSVTDNRELTGVVHGQYAWSALVPASPWLGSAPPARPVLTVVENNRFSVSINWAATGGPAWLWVLESCTGGAWTTEILPASQTMRIFENSKPDIISVSAVDRVGNLSPSMAIKKGPPATVGKAR